MLHSSSSWLLSLVRLCRLVSRPHRVTSLSAGFIIQIEHHLVGDGFIKFVGVNIAAKDFDAFLFVCLEQGGAGEADEHGMRQHLLHGVV